MSAAHFTEQGFAIAADVLSAADCDALTEHAARLGVASAGSRNVLAQPWCAQLARILKTHPAMVALLPADAVAVQCTLFAKTAHKNWAVAPHQDLSIPVCERVPDTECTGWARKEGVLYTQPPIDVLSALVAVRVHLDACPLDAGPLQVVPGSHRAGRLDDAEITQQRAQRGERVCAAPRGAALVMRPLLIHASPRMAGQGVRRVLHFVFGPQQLPCGLQWHQAV